MVLRMKNVNVMGVYSKVRLLRGEEGGVHEKPTYRRRLSKKGGAWTVETPMKIYQLKIYQFIIKY